MISDPDKKDDGLPCNPLKSCLIPRPIGWISSITADGMHNIASFSQFQNHTFDPPYVMFAVQQNSFGTRKDSAADVEQTGEFVYNMATHDFGTQSTVLLSKCLRR